MSLKCSTVKEASFYNPVIFPDLFNDKTKRTIRNVFHNAEQLYNGNVMDFQLKMFMLGIKVNQN